MNKQRSELALDHVSDPRGVVKTDANPQQSLGGSNAPHFFCRHHFYGRGELRRHSRIDTARRDTMRATEGSELEGGQWPPGTTRLARAGFSVFDGLLNLSNVMPGLVPGIHVLLRDQGVDGRDKPGHDG
jgi:hypothetical protein